MTGVAELYLFLRRPHSHDARTRLKALFRRERYDKNRFVVLSWKRTGSNLFCGILHHHPEITMHNELFNPIDIFTYYPATTKRAIKATNNSDGNNTNENNDVTWTHLARDLYPDGFLEHIWTGKYADGSEIKIESKAVGFKSFPDHWPGKNEEIWKRTILEDHRIKKIILIREDELGVFVSMLRAEKTGHYMTHKYPKGLKVHIDPSRFQAFLNNYRDTFQRKYKSPTEKRDTFRISYEQIIDKQNFNESICPQLWRFLGVDEAVQPKVLRETVKQADEDEDLTDVITNYEELEYCFKYTDVKPFSVCTNTTRVTFVKKAKDHSDLSSGSSTQKDHSMGGWSILLPICSRKTQSCKGCKGQDVQQKDNNFNANRLSDLVHSSQHYAADTYAEEECWKRLEVFATSLKDTSTPEKLRDTVCVVGIDVDDKIFGSKDAEKRIRKILPTKVKIVSIEPIMYGHVCRIWNHLANKTGQDNDFVVLLGDDIVLKSQDWQKKIEIRFKEIADRTGLPFGAACVAMNDESFPGFPTFPVLHRWHINHFGRLLPKQFINQGGDPYLYELYSRWNASSFEMTCRLCNTLGGDNDARYTKYSINWPGQILTLSLMKLEEFLDGRKPTGICLDVVVPSYRPKNREILERIVSLRASIHLNVRYWIVIDNPNPSHLKEVNRLAMDMRERIVEEDGNYFVNVIHYGENRGASYARNTGFNYSTADWILFLDDDVIPDKNILDAYAGAMYRYPEARVFVGETNLPQPCNLWTNILHASNVMYFYGVAKHRTYPPWGVTANLLVRGSRHNHIIQFKTLYPKTGGGEDIDFVFQMKEWYGKHGRSATRSVVGVSGAKVVHPWWNGGKTCYKQICGWAWGDSLCIVEWPEKTYLCLPNWIEFIVCILPMMALYNGVGIFSYGVLQSALFVTLFDHFAKVYAFYSTALKTYNDDWSNHHWLIISPRAMFVALCAGTVISSQEITRLCALIYRLSIYSFCRRMDWFDGQAKTELLDIQLRTSLFFFIYLFASCNLCDISLKSVTSFIHF